MSLSSTSSATSITNKDKHKFYQLLLQQAKNLLQTENDLIANAANLSSLLYHTLPQVNWAGVYLLKNGELVLGPFHGQVACTRIPLSQGVCGTAFSQNKTLLVADIHAFAGHIACDATSASEIVIPFSSGISSNNKIPGVVDIDSPILNRFDEIDQEYLEQIVKLL